MARNDGVDRLSARNVNLSASKIGNAQKHNEREKESYINQDIVPERTALNVHFKTPSAGYQEMFAQLVEDKVISTRGLNDDANLYGELIFDVNSAYFHNHGGYEYAKQFYEDAYKAAIQIVGGEQYILSAVMYADERNPAMSEALRKDVFHYHMHVVYIPAVEKEILWSKRCKDPALVGTVKERIMQVSSSKKWLSKPAIDEDDKPILQKNGKPVLRKSYSVLQDDFFNFMRAAGYDDVERGERGSSEEHLTVTQFKAMKEASKLTDLEARIEKQTQALEKIKAQKLSIKAIDQIEAKPISLSNRVSVDPEEFQSLKTAAKKYVAEEKESRGLRKLLKAANETIAALKAELSEYKSIRGKLKSAELERENAELKKMVGWYRSIIEKFNLGNLFQKSNDKYRKEEIR